MLLHPPISTLFPYTTLFRSPLRICPETASGSCPALSCPLAIRASRASDRCCRQRRSRSEEHTSELQSLTNLVCRLLLEKKKLILLITHVLLYRTHDNLSTPL